MKNFLLLCVGLFICYFSIGQEPAKKQSNSYKDAGNQYKIEVQLIQTDGIQFEFDCKTFKNNNILFRDTLIGCRNDDFPLVPEISHLKLPNNETIGWIIKGFGSICGNTRSRRTFFLLPRKSKSHLNTIDSKIDIHLNPISDTNSIELWYYVQEWGLGGTSDSFFVPRKKVLFYNKKKKKYQWKKGNILKNFDALKEIEKIDEYLTPTYLGLITAAISDNNAAIVQLASEKYFNEKYADWYKSQQAPNSHHEINELFEHMDKNFKLPKKYSHFKLKD